MYDGTPFASKDIIGTPSMTDFLVEEATNYSECLTNELYLSFGLGERIESSDIWELKAIAKSCAQQFYGTYFDGKSYTTREEYLMMLLTVFGEDVSFEWDFTDDGRYVSTGTGVESGFANVALTAWYSPYLAYADEIGILSTDEVKWSVAKMISDREAIDMLSLYTAYRMGYTGTDMLQKGMIQIKNYEYNFIFISVSEVKIEVKTDSVKKIAIDTKKASNLFPSWSFYEMLDNCQASITKFKHPFTWEMMKKEIVGISNNKCIYIEEMPNNGKMTCSYNDIERRIAAQFYYHISTNDYSANASTSNGKATSTYEINGKVYNNPLQDFLDNEICIITGY